MAPLENLGPERLELSHIAAPDPKSGASTNFATGPIDNDIIIAKEIKKSI